MNHNNINSESRFRLVNRSNNSDIYLRIIWYCNCAEEITKRDNPKKYEESYIFYLDPLFISMTIFNEIDLNSNPIYRRINRI